MLHASALHDQFFLSTHDMGRKGWRSYQNGGYFLRAHPSLPVHPLLDQTSHAVGWFLGWPINQSANLVRTTIQLPFTITTQNADRLESFIYGFGGRYAFVILAPDLKRVYLDPAGTLAMVFSEKGRMAGSSVAALVLDEPDHPLWSRPLRAFPNDKPNKYWPAGTTLDPDITRLLPNHYLDLVSWQAVRHYPKTSLKSMPEKDVPESIERLVSVLQRHIEAVVKSSPHVYMPLTSGRDSRMLLACSRPWTNKIDYATFDYRPWRRSRGERIDLYIADQLVTRFGLRQSIVPISPTPPPNTDLEYLHRTGFSGGSGKSRDFFFGCLSHLDTSAAWLTGFAGEVGRAFYWHDTDSDTERMSATELLTRIAMPLTDRFENAMAAWLHSLPDVPLSTVLDLVYLEHRVGCWATPHFYGFAPFSLNMTPFSHREIFDIMLRLPYAYRRDSIIGHDIISTAWPELLSLPFKNYPGLRGSIGLWVIKVKRQARMAIKQMVGMK